MIIVANFVEHIDFPFQYIFAVSIFCILARIGTIIQFNETLGPLLKIVSKMSQDFLNFFMLYALVTVTFLLVGNINFIYELPEFKDLFTSALTIINASVGNFDSNRFLLVKDPGMAAFG